MPDSYGSIVRTARQAAGLSLAHVAGALGISVPYLSDVERGARGAFGAERTTRLAMVLECDWRPLVKAALAEREPGLWELLADRGGAA